MFKKCLENRITHLDRRYKCHLCNEVLGSCFASDVDEHIQGKKHRKKLDQIDERKRKKESDLVLESSEQQLKNIVGNSIIFNKSSLCFDCCNCQCTINGLSNTLKHMNSVAHLKKTMKCTAENNKATLQQMKTLEKVNGNVVHRENSLESCFTVVGWCPFCHVLLKDNSIVQYHVMLHLNKELKELSQFDVLECRLVNNEIVYLKCTLCNYSCKSSMSDAHTALGNHFTSKAHLDRLKFFNHTKTDSSLHVKHKQIDKMHLKVINCIPTIASSTLCNICEVTFTSANANDHRSGKIHQKNLQNFVPDTSMDKKSKFDGKNCNFYKCFICDKSFSKVSILFEHYKAAGHQWKFKAFSTIEKCLYTNFQESNTRQVVGCSLCGVTLLNPKAAMAHILGNKHKEKLQMSDNMNHCKDIDANPTKVSRKRKHVTASPETQSVPIKKTKKADDVKASVSELNQLDFGKKDTQSVSTVKCDAIDFASDNLVYLEFSNSQIKNLPASARTSLFGAKFNDQRDLIATNILCNAPGKQYIKMCVDPGLGNIYNTDHDKISTLKLGLSLTFSCGHIRACLACRLKFPDDAHSIFEHLQRQEHLRNIHEMQVDDEKLEKFPEQSSDLRLSKLYMRKKSSGSIACYCCSVEIPNKNEIIRQHAEKLIHKEKSKFWGKVSGQLFNQYLKIYKDIWYYAQFFYCEICNQKCESEMDFVIHLIDEQHVQKVYELTSRGVALTYDLCPSCVMYQFGKTDWYETHCRNNFHRDFAENKDFGVPDLTITASEFLDNIDKNVDFLEFESNRVEWEKDQSEAVLLKAITETVKHTYPHVTAYIFGSRLSRSGFPDSDVDLFLDCANTYYINSTQQQSQQYVKTVISYFESTPNTWIVDEVLLSSRVPIIKLRHIPTSLKCDISFASGLSVEKSELLRLYNANFPTCRKLILFMKKWLIQCRLSGSNCMTSFAISWAVIFYLQLEGFLPTVHALVNRANKSKIVNGWECGFADKFTVESSNLSFKEHLKGFFTYFSEFDYQTSVICPYLGKAIDKRAFAYTKKLPSEMDVYKTRSKNKEVQIFQYESPMCIQDPVDLSQNMTKAVNKQQLRCFRQYCILSAEKC